jgi:hypothetical protein
MAFRPTPNLAAVAAGAVPVMRFVSNPPSITANGPQDLPSQDRPLPVYHSVYLWSVSYPDSALAVQRSKEFSEIAVGQGQFSQRDAQAKENRR